MMSAERRTMEKKREAAADPTQQAEDAAMKTAMQFFADELLPYFEIGGKVSRIAATELVHLEVKKLFEDFNLEMEDGTWKHFEFQSTNEGKRGLKRFRVYEALASYQHKVSITTYVLFSGKIKAPMTEFTEGINTYRVCPIIMKHENADEWIGRIQEKMDRGIPLVKKDVVPLALSPLMGGETRMPDRIRAALRTVKQTELDEEETKKLEAVIYAMAEKFLEKADLEEIRKEIRMTRLGQMMVEEGKREGIKEGIKEGKIEILADLVQDGVLSVEEASVKAGLTEKAFKEKVKEGRQES